MSKRTLVIGGLLVAAAFGYGQTYDTPAAAPTYAANASVATTTTIDPMNGATRVHALIDLAARDAAAERVDAKYGVSGLTLFCTGDYLSDMVDDLGSEDSAAVAAIFAERDALGAPARTEVCQ